jgi:tRNA uridine 5-carbamoylmethylation protein Kti12
LASYLVVIYGAPLSGKSSVAWRLARSLPDKTAVVSFDGLIQGSIAVRADDEAAEFEMVHIQARLLVANYMKNGYNVVVEGPFYYQSGGQTHNHERDVDQLVALMRQMTRTALVVQLTASREAIERRAAEAWREEEIPESVTLSALYRPRYGANSMSLDTSDMSVEAAVLAIAERLMAKSST